MTYDDEGITTGVKFDFIHVTKQHHIATPTFINESLEM
jgi:hypothetical protein